MVVALRKLAVNNREQQFFFELKMWTELIGEQQLHFRLSPALVSGYMHFQTQYISKSPK
jgi:hypothetical protein